MPSLKSHVVSFVLRHSRKQAFASPENLQRWIAAARKTENRGPPASLHQRLDIEMHTVDG
ncbi:alpha/beta hydrolase, partial [Mesorhizobium sp. M7A.F.Ca.US.001.02.1.1]